ncbi:extracellular solute-binding protein [Pseudonocardia sp.]|uniref:ABC transporter substrate-binding protein n=1 Tax=Pseudonocardia sp. TaxID=60912 RepID=UPI0031FC8C65
MKHTATLEAFRLRTGLRFAAVAAVAALALGGCAATGTTSDSQGTAENPVTITMWDWVDSSEAIKLFEASHPNIKVKLDLVSAGGPTYAKMFAAIKAGNAPDVGLIELNTLPQFIGTGGLLDLNKYGANDIKSDFLPWAWSQVSNAGGVYALPLSASPIGYHYNTALLAKYGVTKIPTTYAELATAAATYHKNNPEGYLIDVPPTANYLALLTWQAGGRWFKASGDEWQVGFTSAQSKEVADYLQGLVDAKLAFTEASYLAPWYQALSNGTLASFVGPQWADSLLSSQVTSQAGTFAISTAPQWTAGTQVDGQEGGGSLAVFKNTTHPEAAYTFVKWMLTDPQAQSLNFKSGYGWPTTTSGGTIPELDAKLPYFKDQNPKPIYSASNAATQQDWQWGPNYATVTTDLNGLLAKALSGQSTIWQALQQEQTTELARLKAAGINATTAP